MNWSESDVFDIISNCGNWTFVEMFKPDGSPAPQAKQYGTMAWYAYPDFEKLENEKPVLFIEVKGYTGFFDQNKDALAMSFKQFNQYFMVQRKECSEIRIVFVIRNSFGKSFYWETLDNIAKMEFYFNNHKSNYKTDCEKYIFWNKDDFRTDIKNLAR